MRILVVEDERKLARALRESLEAAGYEVTLAATGEEGFFLINAQTFDLVLLDLMLPGRDGLEVLTVLRQRNLETRVLVLTARDTLEDRVQGLDCGADDYLAKPFAFTELPIIFLSSLSNSLLSSLFESSSPIEWSVLSPKRIIGELIFLLMEIIFSKGSLFVK